MSKLIAIIGSSGAGKTSLVRSLAKTNRFATAYEQHSERPFQALAKQDLRYILANQMDYLMLRAEQEKVLRASHKFGLMDGGLDLDFHGFTRLFLSRNLLSQNEFDLCRSLYQLIRGYLPPPDLIVHLKADKGIIADRLSKRKRINLASASDTVLFNSHVDEWLSTISSHQIMQLDVSKENLEYTQSVGAIFDRIKETF
jgi:deoxyadenosine/deoxycytidine kinase